MSTPPTNFIEFPKMPRFARDCIITEKIDGTNACIYITESGEFFTGSRTRWITPDQDNHGFSRWAHEHKGELVLLGPGLHFGEWWGSGIQRGYGLAKGEKRFSLFNVQRWCLASEEPQIIPSADPRVVKMQSVLPPCCHLVPVLRRSNFSGVSRMAESAMHELRERGSLAAPGFKKPEGIVIFHIAGNCGFKMTLEKDDQPKGNPQP